MGSMEALTVVQCVRKRLLQLRRVEHAVAATLTASARANANVTLPSATRRKVQLRHLAALQQELRDEDAAAVVAMFDSALQLEDPRETLSRLRELQEAEQRVSDSIARLWTGADVAADVAVDMDVDASNSIAVVARQLHECKIACARVLGDATYLHSRILRLSATLDQQELLAASARMVRRPQSNAETPPTCSFTNRFTWTRASIDEADRSGGDGQSALELVSMPLRFLRHPIGS